jgi:hypothetical protein
MKAPWTSARRVAAPLAILTVALLSCGRELTAPRATPANGLRPVGLFSFAASYDAAQHAGVPRSALGRVDFERVHIVLRRDNGAIALDTSVVFPSDADSLALVLNVPLPVLMRETGEPLTLNLGYVNAAGDTVFRGGPIPLTLSPFSGGPPPPPVQVPVQYTGPGANAARVVIAPRAYSGLSGDRVTFSAAAQSATGATIPGTPVVFRSDNPAVVVVENDATGAVRLVGRGSAHIIAQLLSGQEDAADVSVTLPASKLTLVSGGGQSGNTGAELTQRIVARVTASDDVPVAGVSVAVDVTGNGTATPANVVSANDGTVSVAWKLGAAPGAQTLRFSAPGITPLSVTATAVAVVVPTQLNITTQPSAQLSGATMTPAVVVQARDASGALAPSFTGTVTAAIATGPAGAALGGTSTATATGGVATFASLVFTKPGTYTLSFSAAGLASVTSAPFVISAATAAEIVADSGDGQTAAAGTVLPRALVVRITDAFGNPVSGQTVNWSVTSGGGSVSPAASVTDAEGRARTSFTLGASAGANSVAATSGTLAGSPVAFSATGTRSTSGGGSGGSGGSGGGGGSGGSGGGVATRLRFVTAPSSAIAGAVMRPAIVVEARRSGDDDDVASSFTGTVTLSFAGSSNGATLGGTVTVPAVNGVATFSDITVSKSNPSYRLTATATGLRPDTSGNFTIAPDIPTRMTIESGDNQRAPAGSTITIAVLIADTFGNPVPGRTVTWSVLTGGGSMASPTSQTDNSGIARMQWTLGAGTGNQSARATSGTLTGSPRDFTATAIPR